MTQAEPIGLKPRAGWQRCPGSKGTQMLAWPPGPGYAGAVVCLGCSFGVLIIAGTDHPAASQAGYEGTAGTVRVHEVRQVAVSPERGPHPFEAAEMRYLS